MNPLTTNDNSVIPKSYRALLLVMILASVIPIWATDHFPSQNGPWYLLASHVMRNYENPEFNYADYYIRHWHPIPHALHTYLMFAFSYVAPPLIAMKLALTVYAIALPLSIFYFLSIAAPDKRFLGFFAFVLVHHYTFYRGYHNFCLSIPLYFFNLGYWLKHKDDFKLKHSLVMAVMTSFLFVAHLFGFLLLACSIGWYRWIETKSFIKGTISAVTASWAGWLLLLDFIYLNSQENSWADPDELEFLRPHTAVEYVFRKFFYSMSVPAYILGAAMLIWPTYLLWRRVSQSPGSWWQKIRSTITNPMVALFLVLCVSYFFVPYKVINWHYANSRLLPFIFILALACAGPIPQWGKRQRGFQTCFIATVCAAGIGIDLLMTWEVVEAEKQIANYTSGIEHFDTNSTLLPIHLDNPARGQVRPLTRAHEYYNIAKGGVNNEGAAYFNTLVPIWYREYPVSKMLPDYDEKAPDESIKAISKVYDFVLVMGDDDALRTRLTDAGYLNVHTAGNVDLFRNQKKLGNKSSTSQGS